MIQNLANERIYNQQMPSSLDYPNVPVGAILKGSARRFGNRDAYIYQDQAITFGELYREALRFANALRIMGVGSGTVVSTHLPTCPQYIIAYYGIILTGATYSPINPLAPLTDVIFQLNDSEARIVITHESFARVIQEVSKDTKLEKVIVTGPQENFSNDNPIDPSSYGENWFSFAELKSSSTEEEFDVSIDPKNDLVHIAYTGGTTGKPKGVMITHANIIANILQSAAWSAGALAKVEEDGALVVEEIEKDNKKQLTKYSNLLGSIVSLSPSPLFHAGGAMGTMVYPFIQGATTILFDRFVPEQFLADIEKYKVTQVGGAPAMWNYLLHHPDIDKYDYSTVNSVNSGAAPLAVEEMKLLMKTFPNARVNEGYGLTEATASVANTVAFHGGLQKLGTVGHPTYNTEVKLISLESDSDEPLPIGEIGEVCVRGPQVMKGYYKNPEATAETIKNGWLLTGDIGMLDENGLLAIVDRKKDMLIYNGFNVYPGKLEDILFEHSAVVNVAVIGRPDLKFGEIVKAFVVKVPGMDVTEEELMEFVNSQVIHYTKIREIEFIDELPTTAAGKISKQMLREMEAQSTSNLSK